MIPVHEIASQLKLPHDKAVALPCWKRANSSTPRTAEMSGTERSVTCFSVGECGYVEKEQTLLTLYVSCLFKGSRTASSFNSSYIRPLYTYTTPSLPSCSLHMAHHNTVPFVAQDDKHVAELINNLETHCKKGAAASKTTFSCKKTAFPVAQSKDNIVVDSWRLQDWDYKRPDLPTYARGLFTYHTKDGRPQIATRGYDKFFNTDEVTATKWGNIEKFTKAPYELSLKENGCIIFISGLDDDTLLVCSKHSTGERSDTELSHAKAGEQWVDRQLKAIGKTRQELARELRKRNATAVAELCDDNFEEHILAYRGDQAGLYLHGININIPNFMTYPGAEVQRFADDWGFKRTDFLVIDDLAATRKFLESVAETGHYNGRDVEGFVIRCKSKQHCNDYEDWFFKYKFEEPYLLYRQWRECTKALINGKPPRYKKHAKITEEYLLYARRILASNKHLAKEYNENHGIIELRDAFLTEKNLKGSDIIRMEYAATGGPPADVSRDVILVPIATIGCGKTTIAVALTHLFGWGHVQNDNITGKNRPPRFTQEALDQLKEKPVVYADRNNAQRHERKQLIGDVHKATLTARLVALNFAHDQKSVDKMRQVTQARVLARGDNHQTIQAASETNKVIGIMEGFIKRYEPVNTEREPDDGFDLVIDLDPTMESRTNLETIIGKLHETYPKLFSEMPSGDDLDNAIAYAMSQWKPDIKHSLGPQNHHRQKENQKPAQNKNQPKNSLKAPATPKRRALEYMAIKVPGHVINNTLQKVFGSLSNDQAAFFHRLQTSKRVQPKFHVTLMHRSSAKQQPEIWEKYKELHASKGGEEHEMGHCQVQLERAVWNDMLMAIVVRIVGDGWECTNALPHITIGTRADDIKPRESNDLLAAWLEHGSSAETGIGEVSLGNVVVDGVVQGVLQRY